MEKVFETLFQNLPFFTQLIKEHLWITFLSASSAILIGLCIGILIAEKKKIANIVISMINILYTIPAIALFGILISFTGIGNTTAIIALTIYALLPIVRSTYVGLTTIDPKIIEASIAMGATHFQTLMKIKLPIAFPVIFAAIRNMVVMTIALAGIASFVGAGGLGVAIYRGITTNNQSLVFVGSVCIAILSLLVDAIMGLLQKHRFKHRYFLMLLVVLFSFTFFPTRKQEKIVVASKPTTESYILAEMVAQLIKKEMVIPVEVKHGIGGGTANLHPAIVKGEIDLYPEYTATAWQIVLKEKTPYQETLFPTLNQKYNEKFGLTMLPFLGFNNTYRLGIHAEVAKKFRIAKMSELKNVASKLVFGAEYDFFEREDGFKALSQFYQLQFKKNVDMDNGLKYQALLNKKIDVMTVFTTDGQLTNDAVVMLEDDLNFYPSYLATYVVRQSTFKKYPSLEKTLMQLSQILNEKQMAKLNYAVEVENQTPQSVAHQFLKNKGLVK